VYVTLYLYVAMIYYVSGQITTNRFTINRGAVPWFPSWAL